MPPMTEDGAIPQGLQMSRPESLFYQDFPSLLRNPSSFMGEGALRTPFSRNASATFQMPMGFPYVQRTPSYEGSYFPDVSQNYLAADVAMYPAQSMIYRVRCIRFPSLAAAFSAHHGSSGVADAGACRGAEASAVVDAGSSEEAHAEDE